MKHNLIKLILCLCFIQSNLYLLAMEISSTGQRFLDIAQGLTAEQRVQFYEDWAYLNTLREELKDRYINDLTQDIKKMEAKKSYLDSQLPKVGPIFVQRIKAEWDKKIEVLKTIIDILTTSPKSSEVEDEPKVER